MDPFKSLNDSVWERKYHGGVGAPISGGRIPSTASIAGGCRSQRFGPPLETE